MHRVSFAVLLSFLPGAGFLLAQDPPDCEEACVRGAEEAYVACVVEGGSEAECHERVTAIAGVCLERCALAFNCDSRCALSAEVVYAGCAIGGISDEECRYLANGILERCAGDCAPPPSCEERCEDVALRAVLACHVLGGSDEDCAELGELVGYTCYHHCVAESVPPCDVHCVERAHEFASHCVAERRPEEECAAQAGLFIVECLDAVSEGCDLAADLESSAFQPFRRGDANRDGRLNLADPIAIFNELFLRGEPSRCEDAADVNDDGAINIADPTMLIHHVFLGLHEIPEPHDTPGQDPTADALLCED